MGRENLDEILKHYERIKDYTNKLDNPTLSKLISDLEERVVSYLEKRGGVTLAKDELVELPKREKGREMNSSKEGVMERRKGNVDDKIINYGKENPLLLVGMIIGGILGGISGGVSVIIALAIIGALIGDLIDQQYLRR